MNLVGKIITLLLFIMSLMFMGLAVVNYATGQNYKAMVNGGDGEPSMADTLSEARASLEKKEAELGQLKLRLAHEMGTRRAALAALEIKSRELAAALDQQQSQFAQLLSQHKQNVGLVSTSQSQISELKSEVDVARAELDDDFKKRDTILKEIAEMTDKLNQNEGQLRRLKERSDQLKRGW